MIAGGTPPDVININSPLTLELDGMLVELTDKMSDLGYFDPQRGLYPGWFTMLSSDGFYDRGEALYQAPLGTGTTIPAYNQRLFDEAGVAHPSADWTWEGEFLEAAKKLSEPENQWGVNGINRGRFGITGAMPAAWGGAFIDTETMTFTGDSPETLASLQFMQDLIYEHGAHPTPAEQAAFGGQIGMFENGTAAMYMLHTFEMPTIYDMPDPWDIQFLPQGPAGSWAPLYGGRLAVMASSEHQEHGWEFVNLINGPVGQGFFRLTRQEVDARYPGERARRLQGADRVSYHHAGGESLADMMPRARAVAGRLDERTALIVAHSGINRVLVAVLAGLEARLNDLYQPHDVIYRIDWADGSPIVTHLRDGSEHPGPYTDGWS